LSSLEHRALKAIGLATVVVGILLICAAFYAAYQALFNPEVLAKVGSALATQHPGLLAPIITLASVLGLVALMGWLGGQLIRRGLDIYLAGSRSRS